MIGANFVARSVTMLKTFGCLTLLERKLLALACSNILNASLAGTRCNEY